jgi:glycosyltransferase involved in cell wall biosynthesis
MKILILSQYFWPESFRINELVDSLKNEDCEITILTGQPNYPDGVVHKGYRSYKIGSEVHNGYTIYRIPLMPRGNSGAVRLFLNYVSFIISGCIFGPWLLRGKKIDTIFVYAPSPILQAIPAILIAKIKNATITTWVGDLWPQSLEITGFIRNKIVLRLVESVVCRIYKSNDLILVQSYSFIEAINKISDAVPIEYFPNPGESVFSDDCKQKKSGLILPKGFNIVFAGNLGGVQALDTLLDAAEILRNEKNIFFILIGSGSRSGWLSRKIQENKLENVRMLGRYEPNCMPDIFTQADALLVSLVKSEIYKMTVPAKVQTYMAAGRPIICALEGEGATIVNESGSGIVIEPENAIALAGAIMQLKNMTLDDRNKLGLSGRKYHENNFDSRVLSNRLFKRLFKLKSEKINRR